MPQEAKHQAPIYMESGSSLAPLVLPENAKRAKLFSHWISFFSVVVPTDSVMLHRFQRDINMPGKFRIRNVFVQGIHDHTDGLIHLGVLPLPGSLTLVLFQNGRKEILYAGLGCVPAGFGLCGRLIWYEIRPLRDLWIFGSLRRLILVVRMPFYCSPDSIINSLDGAFEGRGGEVRLWRLLFARRQVLDGLRRFSVSRPRCVIVQLLLDRFEACFEMFNPFALPMDCKDVASTADDTVGSQKNQPVH